ncbi:hypothetical protein B0T22DRAFT_10645 [Podospora appendiculata]|uniref:Uncharacterized protein n=1 Tax=Podospora appendiculata TaxID=314037 RepID=A0AAE1CFD1_9PEZI|nr:hypothetical protein B0T22DRAFT_10645 [Podospora appendiculata]
MMYLDLPWLCMCVCVCVCVVLKAAGHLEARRVGRGIWLFIGRSYLATYPRWPWYLSHGESFQNRERGEKGRGGWDRVVYLRSWCNGR